MAKKTGEFKFQNKNKMNKINSDLTQIASKTCSR